MKIRGGSTISSIFSRLFHLSPLRQVLPCCRKRQQASRFYTTTKAVTPTILVETIRRPRSSSIVGGCHVPLEADEVVKHRQACRRYALPSIQEEVQVCEDCIAFFTPKDVIVLVNDIEPRRHKGLEVEKRVVVKPVARRASDSLRKPLPLQLNRMTKPSKYAFANMPRRESATNPNFETPRCC
ncbi:hypothetical protein LEN26_006589 [Aphanomyces euteiches]|nr:hypothetical protein LEN26_006589 [Aphanomyces euteiches]